MKSENILYIDIETVAQFKVLDNAPSEIQNIWNKKHDKNEYLRVLSPEESYVSKAAIFAEYGKIICISIGYYHQVNEKYRVKSFAGNDEKKLLEDFKAFCLKLKKNYVFCGHNIKEFDIPYLCRRFLINRISIPPLLNFQDKKPWEVDLIDTLQLWKFGDYKNYTSLETLTTIFNIPTPKVDIDGSKVGQVYWHENDLARLVEYCQSDVVAVIQLYRAFHQQDLVSSENIEIIC